MAPPRWLRLRCESRFEFEAFFMTLLLESTAVRKVESLVVGWSPFVTCDRRLLSVAAI